MNMRKMVLVVTCIGYCSQSICGWDEGGLRNTLSKWFLDKEKLSNTAYKMGYIAVGAAAAGLWALKERYQKNAEKREFEKLIEEKRAQFDHLKGQIALIKNDEEFLAALKTYIVNKEDEYSDEQIIFSTPTITPEILEHLLHSFALRAEKEQLGKEYSLLESIFNKEQEHVLEYLQQLESKIPAWEIQKRIYASTQGKELAKKLKELAILFQELGTLLIQQKPYMYLKDLVNEHFQNRYAFEIKNAEDTQLNAQHIAKRIQECCAMTPFSYVTYVEQLQREKEKIMILVKALETTKLLEPQELFVQKAFSIAQAFERISAAVQATSMYKEQLFLCNLQELQTKVKELEEQRDNDKKTWEESYKQLTDNYQKVVAQYNESQSSLTQLQREYRDKIDSLKSQISYLQVQQVLRSPYTSFPMTSFLY
jgi:hypothetical protein